MSVPLLILMMTKLLSKGLEINVLSSVFKASCKFLSRVVLQKIDLNAKKVFRKVERNIKNYY